MSTRAPTSTVVKSSFLFESPLTPDVLKKDCNFVMLYVLDHVFSGRHFEKRLVGSADEHETLLCLRLCTGSEDGARRLVDHPSGLFTVAVCVMSNFRYVGEPSLNNLLYME
jgi:hypothetical protein